jgi:hypothetical protein
MPATDLAASNGNILSRFFCYNMVWGRLKALTGLAYAEADLDHLHDCAKVCDKPTGGQRHG